MQYTLSEIAAIVDGNLIGKHTDFQVDHVFTDSRVYNEGAGGLFIAINGPNHKGRDFIPELYNKGARYFMTEPFDGYESLDAAFIFVTDGLRALQKLAAFHRKNFKGKVIGITGSNGKTVVKEWLFHILKDTHNIVRSPKSYNSKLGVPLSLLLINGYHDLALIEAGISMPGEMSVLENMIRPDYGILTNIGSAHIENFESQTQLYEEKMVLFRQSEWVVSMANNHISNPGNVFLSDVIESDTGNTLLWSEEGEEYRIEFPFNDSGSVQNVESVIRTARLLGVSWNIIAANCKTLPKIAMRLEMRNGINGCKLINDSYNSDVTGLRIALEYQSRFADKSKTVVLSSLQLDRSDVEAVYSQVVNLINDHNIRRLLLVGEDIAGFRDRFNATEVMVFNNTDDLIGQLPDLVFDHEWILIKGARDFGFERISMLLEEKPHSTYLEVNLNNLSDNLQFFRSRIKDEVKVMAMVKALSYGAGTDEVAQMLEFNRVDYFGVAYASEGVSLREAGSYLPIMVMNVDEGSFDTILRYRLEPVIYSLNQLDSFVRRLISENINNYPVHIELDTGMHRLGFQEADLPTLVSTLKAQPEVRVVSVFSHLSAADEKDMEQFTQDQIDRFETWTGLLDARLPYPFMRHLCNTAGILAYPKAHYDMVRLGIGLYGVDPVMGHALEPVSALFTTVTQIKRISAGEPVGYGCSDKAETDMLIGILPIGYADGMSRALSNGVGYVYHESTGTKLTVIGKVCMDMTMVALPDTGVSEGDRIEIFGKHITIHEFAALRNTIPYEVLTSISSRVVRILVSA